MGVSFVLNFTHTEYIDVVTPHNLNTLAGDFLGTNLLIYFTMVDEDDGTISVGMSRQAGQGGVTGFGTVFRANFISTSNTPNNTQIEFSISAIDSELSQFSTKTVISSEIVSPFDNVKDKV